MSSSGASRRSGGTFDLDRKEEVYAQLQQRAAAQDFWNDPAAAQKVIQEANAQKSWIESWSRLRRIADDIGALLELAEEGHEEEVQTEIESSLHSLESGINDLEFRNMLSGEDDSKNAILVIHSGAGGTEACDWVQILFRMYQRWAERKDFSFEITDLHPGEEAGVKRATFMIKGPYAYGFLKSEAGIHRSHLDQ